MKADNTSAFNCRYRNGVCCIWSQHAFGRALDLNPVENPYVGPWGVSLPTGPTTSTGNRSDGGWWPTATWCGTRSRRSAGSGAATGGPRRTTSTSPPRVADADRVRGARLTDGHERGRLLTTAWRSSTVSKQMLNEQTFARRPHPPLQPAPRCGAHGRDDGPRHRAAGRRPAGDRDRGRPPSGGRTRPTSSGPPTRSSSSG